MGYYPFKNYPLFYLLWTCNNPYLSRIQTKEYNIYILKQIMQNQINQTYFGKNVNHNRTVTRPFQKNSKIPKGQKEIVVGRQTR